MKVMFKIIVMLLIVSSIAVFAYEIKIDSGPGSFVIVGGKEHQKKIIEVYYHKPSSFSIGTKVLFVIPGAGRNGWSYNLAGMSGDQRESLQGVCS